jgi:acetolactate synthase-1/2/3 large subunit
MTGTPAATLLHLGPGFSNGLANLHNARRGRAPLVNVVGDHARAHKRLDAPLESDIDALAGSVSGWVRRSLTPAEVAKDAADAVAAASAAPGTIATLILPADVSWEDGAEVARPHASRAASRVAPSVLDDVAAALTSGEETVLFIGGDVMTADGQLAAAQVAAGTGARLLSETFPARATRGAGLPDVQKLPYPPEMAIAALAGTKHLVLAGALAPVHFFGYPGDVPGHPVPDDCTVHVLSQPGEDGVAALQALAAQVAADAEPKLLEASRPELPSGPLTPRLVSAVVGALLPENAILVDEAITSGVGLAELTSGAPRHDWLSLTGGAIGDGLPMALGAAVACPDRPVIGMQADGSAMYTISALWSYAREQCDVTTIVYDNASYAILEHELTRVGADGDGKRAGQLLDLGGPNLDFVALAQGMGVPATRATTAEELADQLRAALAEPGPHLIDAMIRRD